jgi:predicted flap endonuclease-1-like 5' DNA nuclease
VANTARQTAQQTVSNAQKTASNVADATQKTATTARDTAKSTTASTTGQSSLQNVQPTTSSATVTGNSLSTIPGIEPEIQSKLEAQGITTTQQLLDQTSTKDERTSLSQSAGVSTQMLKTLSDRADLMRIQGVNADVATMLEEAGVAGSKDLRRRNPENLHATLEEERTIGNNAYSVPSVDQLTQWIADAMALTSSTQE